ncbi:unnamed protein product, partial [Mesorhabditis spiculigera]
MITPKFTSTPLKKKSKIPFMRSTKSLKSLTKFGGNIDGSNLWPAIDEDVAEAEEEKPQQNKKTPLPPPRKSRLPPPPALLAEAIDNKENNTTTGPSEGKSVLGRLSFASLPFMKKKPKLSSRPSQSSLTGPSTNQ